MRSGGPLLSVSFPHIQQRVLGGTLHNIREISRRQGTKNLEKGTGSRVRARLISTPRKLDQLPEICFRSSGRYERPWKHRIRGLKRSDLRNAGSVRYLTFHHDTVLLIIPWNPIPIGWDAKNILRAQANSLSTWQTSISTTRTMWSILIATFVSFSCCLSVMLSSRDDAVYCNQGPNSPQMHHWCNPDTVLRQD